MDELVRWLGEQLDEDVERATTAAEEDGPDWRYDGHAVVTRREGDLVAVGSQEFMEPFRGEHIAEWDPARVLREIEAKRQILKEWRMLSAARKSDPSDATARTGLVAVEVVLQSLATVYRDRPGYRAEEWSP